MDTKPGWKTTEFWLTCIGMAAQFLAGIPLPQATLAAAALGGVYTIGRSVVKARAAAPGSLHSDGYVAIAQGTASAVVDAVKAVQAAPGRQ